MKLFVKKIIITIVIFIIFLFILDISVFYIDLSVKNKRIADVDKNLKNIKKTYVLDSAVKNYSVFIDDYKVSKILSEDFRNPIIKNKKGKNIFIFGCSFAYGSPLDDDETFAAYLAEETGYSVYNFAYGGWGVQHFLALLENYDFSKIEPPQYIIYIFNTDHIRRMFLKYFEYVDSCYFRYLWKNNRLCADNLNLPTLYIYRKLNLLYTKKRAENQKNNKDNFSFFTKHIEKINSLIKEKFPKSKFIIFIYDDFIKYDWTPIEQMGITVIRKDDLCSIDNDKRLPDGHPSANTWKTYTPLFIKASKIKKVRS